MDSPQSKIEQETMNETDEKVVSKEMGISKILDLKNIRDAIPSEAFEKSLIKSLAFMFFDLGAWFLATYYMVELVHSSFWTSFPFWQKALISLCYWNIAGFFMWCIFVVGHDCGHGTFSSSEKLNDVLGHFLHSSILVPFYPWQLSHRRHHMFHNHKDKDYSFPWYTEEKLQKEEEWLARFANENRIISVLFPFIGWPMYLYGMPDGSHFYPNKNHRIWKESDSSELSKCLISSGTVLLSLSVIFHVNQYILSNVLFYYVIPWIIFGWWLVTVTYLQHHGPETVSYEDEEWKFVKAAFETVDRNYGYGIDFLHHHITDGHVVHHLFFTKIPHYNLPIATAALRKYLSNNGVENQFYRHENTYDFMFRIYYYLFQYSFLSKTSKLEKA